jgi:AhpD family alkylhydroperoxidase
MIPKTKETMMTERLNPYAAAPKLVNLLIDFGKAVIASGLEPSLMELVKIRASQINGCAVCLQMHTSEARRNGETEERLYLLDGWHEASLYSERERAALGWTEALIRIADRRVPDEAYQAVKAQFSDEEIVKLSLLVNAINSFNQLNVGFRIDPARVLPRKAA